MLRHDGYFADIRVEVTRLVPMARRELRRLIIIIQLELLRREKVVDD